MNGWLDFLPDTTVHWKVNTNVIIGSSPKSLDDLPDEILLQVFSYIDPHRSERVLGHLPDDPPPNPPDDHLIQDFLAKNRPFCNLALANKRFRDVVQEHLLFAPVVGGFSSLSPPDQRQSRIACFLRTLLARPQLGRHVKQIRLCVPLLDRSCSKPFMKVSDQSKSIHDAFDTIMALGFPEHLTTKWKDQIDLSCQYTLMSVLFLFLSQLETVVFADRSPEISQAQPPGLDTSIEPERILTHNLIGIHPDVYASKALSAFHKLPIARTLTYVKISGLVPIRLHGLDAFPNLRTMDISLKLAGLDGFDSSLVSGVYYVSDGCTDFDRIRHLRLDCQVRTTGIWDLSARISIADILEAFRNLESLDFYAEESCSKNPFSSVRAFPWDQSDIQNYPKVSSALDLAVLDQIWDERIHEARTEYTDYQVLVDGLVSKRDRLKSLRLPGGFWTLPGATRKMLPRFDTFTQLQRLVVPQAAILSIRLDSMEFADTDHPGVRLLPTAVLPASIQHLKIFDADADLLDSEWLRELFNVQIASTRWPQMRKVEILFGPLYDDLALRSLLVRHNGDCFWEMVDQACFQVCIARDDEVPSVCV